MPIVNRLEDNYSQTSGVWYIDTDDWASNVPPAQHGKYDLSISLFRIRMDWRWSGRSAL